MESLGYLPSAFVFNPNDYADIEKRAARAPAASSTSAPRQSIAAPKRLWSTSVVTTSALAAGTGLLLVAGLRRAGRGRQAGGLVDWSENVADDFLGMPGTLAPSFGRMSP